jgi:hypothetical protein
MRSRLRANPQVTGVALMIVHAVLIGRRRWDFILEGKGRRLELTIAKALQL